MSLPRLFLNRVSVETRKLSQDLPPEITCWPEEEDKIGIFRAVMKGPLDSPYAGGIFTLRIVLPQRYPHEPPKVNFVTRIYHPNVDDKGRICLDILKSLPKGSWTSGQNIMSTLMSIYSLLSNPNADDPLDIEAATLFKNDRLLFNETVKNITKLHATGEDTEKNLGDELESLPLEPKESESSVRRQKTILSLKKGKPIETKPELEPPTKVTNNLTSPKPTSTSNISKKQTLKIFSLKKIKEIKKDQSPTEPYLPEDKLVACSIESSKKQPLDSPTEVSNQKLSRGASKNLDLLESKCFSVESKKKSRLNTTGTVTPNTIELDEHEISENKKNVISLPKDTSRSRTKETSALTNSIENIPFPDCSNVKPNSKLKKTSKKKNTFTKVGLDVNSSDKDFLVEDSGVSKNVATLESKKLSSETSIDEENQMKTVKKSRSKTSPNKTKDIEVKPNELNASNSSVRSEPPSLADKTSIHFNSEQHNILKSNPVTEPQFPPKYVDGDKLQNGTKADLMSIKTKPQLILSSGESTPRSTSPTLTKRTKPLPKPIHRLPTPNLDAPPHPMKGMYDVIKSTSPGLFSNQLAVSKASCDQKTKPVSLDKKEVSPKRKRVPVVQLQSPEPEPSHVPNISLPSSKNINPTPELLITEDSPQEENHLLSKDNLSLEKKRGWRPSPLRPTGKLAQDGSGRSRRPTFSLKKLRKV